MANKLRISIPSDHRPQFSWHDFVQIQPAVFPTTYEITALRLVRNVWWFGVSWPGLDDILSWHIACELLEVQDLEDVNRVSKVRTRKASSLIASSESLSHQKADIVRREEVAAKAAKVGFEQSIRSVLNHW